MLEPLVWNNLQEAADWLTQETGIAFTQRDVLSLACDNLSYSRKTVIQIPNPEQHELLYIIRRTEDSQIMARLEESNFSKNYLKNNVPLPKYHVCVGQAPYYSVPLREQDLEDLLKFKKIEKFPLLDGPWGTDSLLPLKFEDSAVMMPYGKKLTVTFEKCGIEKNDLLELTKKAKLLTGSRNKITQDSALAIVNTHEEIKSNSDALPVSKSGNVQNSAQPAHSAAAWKLKTTIKRYPGYRLPLYQLLKAEHAQGRPCPKARDVLEKWKKKKPTEIYEVTNETLKYYDAKGSVKEADLKTIGQAIKNLLDE